MRGWLAAIVAVVVMLGVCAASLVVSLPRDPDNEGVARFVPGDGKVERVAHGTQRRAATVDSARVRGAAALSAAPRAAIQAARPPEDSNPRTTDFWREAVRPAENAAGEHRMHALTPTGLHLLLALAPDRGVAIERGLLELPPAVAPGSTWSSRARARVGSTTVDVTNRSRAAAAADPRWKDQGCLDVTAETVMGPDTRLDVATWCPGRGVVAGTPLLGVSRTPWEGPWPVPALGASPADTAPAVPTVVQAPTHTGDPHFGFGAMPTETFPVSTPGVTLPDGTVVQADTISGALSGWRPDPAGATPTRLVTSWWAQPGGPITHLDVVGDVLLATTSSKHLAAYDSSGRRLWRVRLPDLAPGGPVALGPDAVVVATLSGQVRAYALADGATRWETQLSGGSSRAPVVRDGKVAVMTQDDGLHVLHAATGANLLDQENASGALALDADGTPVTLHIGGELLRLDSRGEIDQKALAAVGRRAQDLVSAHGYLAAFGGGSLTVIDGRTFAEVAVVPEVIEVKPLDTGWLAVTQTELLVLAPNGDIRTRSPLGLTVTDARISFTSAGPNLHVSIPGNSGGVVLWVR